MDDIGHTYFKMQTVLNSAKWIAGYHGWSGLFWEGYNLIQNKQVLNHTDVSPDGSWMVSR